MTVDELHEKQFQITLLAMHLSQTPAPTLSTAAKDVRAAEQSVIRPCLDYAMLWLLVLNLLFHFDMLMGHFGVSLLRINSIGRTSPGSDR